MRDYFDFSIYLKFFVLLGLLSAFGYVYFPLMSRSLFIDETVTSWIIGDNLQNVFNRSLHYQYQSPLYYVLAFFAAKLSASDFALRLPSLISVLGAALFVFGIVSVLFNRRTAQLAAVLFVFDPEVIYSGVTARPYALGLLCACGSFYFFLRWQNDPGRLSLWIAYAVFSVLTVYAHYLLAGIVVIPLFYLLTCDKTIESKRHVLIGISANIALLVFCLLPLYGQIATVFHRKDVLSWSTKPSFHALLVTLCDPRITVALLLYVLAASVQLLTRRKFVDELRSPQFWLIVSWFTLPSLLAFGVSRANVAQIFVSRYFIWHVPATAMLVAVIVTATMRQVFPRTLPLIFCSMIVLALRWQPFHEEDWRGALAFAADEAKRERSIMLVQSGLIEGQSSAWILDPEGQQYLKAPAVRYGGAEFSYAVPLQLSDPTLLRYWREIFDRAREATVAIAVVRSFLLSGKTADVSMLELLHDVGFEIENIKEFANVHVLTFKRQAVQGKL